MALKTLGDALAESGATYSSDNDPDLVADALPFALKLIESILDEQPDHALLRAAAAGGFTQYAWAFVQQEADEAADEDLAAATLARERAMRLYDRARDHGRRGLEALPPGIESALLEGGAARAAALGELGGEELELELVYWTASAWALSISLEKDDPRRLAALPRVEALVRRALEIDEGWSEGALHEFMISFEGGRSAAMGGSPGRARAHFDRAVELSGGLRASPFVAYAESVSVGNQDRREFVSLLERALAVDPDARPSWRLLNLVMQRRARWLLGRADLLFLE